MWLALWSTLFSHQVVLQTHLVFVCSFFFVQNKDVAKKWIDFVEL